MALKSKLEDRIRESGPIPVSEYMTACLLDPEFGFYCRERAIGRRGAFTTAPEISQMFGELIGVFLAQTWQNQDCPSPVTIAELGPGRGTMMSDILRAVSALCSMCRSAELVLLEASPALRRAQRGSLSGRDPRWINQIEQLPRQPLFLVANEFFDALPIRQFRRTASGWNEIFVGIGKRDLEFCEVPCRRPAPSCRGNNAAVGDIVEIRPSADPVVRVISDIIAEYGGAALIIDYGSENTRGDTLQAVESHGYACVLAEPGEADISAHVDFSALRAAARGVSCADLLTQGAWLERMGITHRARVLARSMDGETLRQHMAAHRRLVHPGEMGALFRVMALYPHGGALPPGFGG